MFQASQQAPLFLGIIWTRTSKHLVIMNKCLSLLSSAWFLLILTTFSQEKPIPVPALVNTGQDIPQEVIKATREFRERLLTDPYRPAYHFCVPEDEGRPGDPNGAFFHNGRYHLMYLNKSAGKGFCWGHVSSTDLLYWRYHPDTIGPGDGDEGCFSGGAFVDEDGAAILSYWMRWGPGASASPEVRIRDLTTGRNLKTIRSFDPPSGASLK
jgi:hypothetical protein